MPPEATDFTDDEFARAIAEVEAALAELKQRQAQVERDRHQRHDLQARQQELQATAAPDPAELAAIAAQIETIELNLESRLFRWSALAEPFWQAVRFGGLGVFIGWSLGFWTSQLTPEPATDTSHRPAAVSVVTEPKSQ
ncbi:MAG: DUF2203 domain-containing protein [Spirulinaceae cyanobacterium RM2_2_10]|nr:DUF2203 domain-containing protein [Spirulinaceae cyanobacterium SM2_1_0]NJO20213.1 DUF2203 domain-containing protein [Spirulinaceae cyanobacterium RM2_2_10]